MCHFSLARRWCTVPQVVRFMLILLVIAILHQSTRFFDRKFLPVKYIWEGKIFEGCEYQTSGWVSVKFSMIKYIFLIILPSFSQNFIYHWTNWKNNGDVWMNSKKSDSQCVHNGVSFRKNKNKVTVCMCSNQFIVDYHWWF